MSTCGGVLAARIPVRRPIMGGDYRGAPLATSRATIALHSPAPLVILRHAFIPPDNDRLANLAGSLDEHLRTIAAAFDVRIQRRNESFRVEGAKGHAQRAVNLLQQLYGRAARPIGAEEIE